MLRISKVISQGVTDGQTFYTTFCRADTSFQAIEQQRSKPAILSGYPEPILTTQDEFISGYYLNSTGLDNVAVISVLDFIPQSQQISNK